MSRTPRPGFKTAQNLSSGFVQWQTQLLSHVLYTLQSNLHLFIICCSKFSSHRTVSSTCIVLLSLLSQMIRSGRLFVTMIRNTNLESMSYVIFQLLFSVLIFQYIHVFLLNGNAFSSSLALFVSFLHQNHQF